MNYTERKQIQGLIMLIDFEKAFDSVSWKFIFELLEYFNFGKSIKKMDRSFLQQYNFMHYTKWHNI